jgi:FkbM family methyltransferase
MGFSGLRSSYRTARQVTNLSQAAWFSVARALDLSSTIKVTIHGVEVEVRPNAPDLHVADKTLGGEFDDVLLLVRPLKHNFIIDAGGYIGTVAIMLARAFPEATVVTVEPSRENFAVLKKNTARYSNIIPLNAAIGPVEGRASFYDHADGPWGYSLLANTIQTAEKLKFLHEVEVVTISQIFQKFRATGADLLKLDIEGSEKQLLQDCPSWIPQVRVIAAELHDWIQEGCQDAFRSATRGRRDIISSGELSISTVDY